MSCGEPLIAEPVLRCSHCGRLKALRCHLFGPKRGLYFAECIDLNLISQGKTPEEAIAKLQEAMFGYLAVAFDGGNTEGLVLRPSPIANRVRYHAKMLKKRLQGLFTQKHEHYEPVSMTDGAVHHC